MLLYHYPNGILPFDFQRHSPNDSTHLPTEYGRDICQEKMPFLSRPGTFLLRQSMLDYWKRGWLPHKEELEEMSKINEYLEEAYEDLLAMSQDEDKRLEYEARE